MSVCVGVLFDERSEEWGRLVSIGEYAWYRLVGGRVLADFGVGHHCLSKGSEVFWFVLGMLEYLRLVKGYVLVLFSGGLGKLFFMRQGWYVSIAYSLRFVLG